MKIKPPAVTTGPPDVARGAPVPVRPRFASSVEVARGVCHLIVPSFRSMAVRVVQGGPATGRPLDANNWLLYRPKKRTCPGGGGGSGGRIGGTPLRAEAAPASG